MMSNRNTIAGGGANNTGRPTCLRGAMSGLSRSPTPSG